MIDDIWRSFLAAAAIVTISGCAIGTSTVDDTVADEVQDRAASAPLSEDDLREYSVEARPGLVPVPSQSEPTRLNPGEAHGPYPEPWSSKPD